MNEQQAARVGILGAAGRMGRTLVQAVAASEGRVTLGAAFEHAASADLGADASTLAGLPASGVAVQATLNADTFDVLIDFTRPEALAGALSACRQRRRGLVIGTTGYSADQRAAIEQAATEIPICMSGNFSVGIFLLQRLSSFILLQHWRGLVILRSNKYRAGEHSYCQQSVTQCVPDSVHCLFLCYSIYFAVSS